jgi:CxxC-x17-CxxC domain-containing protein
MNFQDRTLVCQDCGSEFTFTADDQEFFARRGYSPPKRCPTCRSARRAERGGGGSGQGRPLYPAVCANCGKDTEVPFEPRGDRPVYCRECYAAFGERRQR